MTVTIGARAGDTSRKRVRSAAGRMPGVVVAGATAVVSGVALFVNSYGVHALRQPAVYTTAKNLVAAVVLLAGVGMLRLRGGPARRPESAPSLMGPGHWVALAYVGVVGGGVAFVLF